MLALLLEGGWWCERDEERGRLGLDQDIGNGGRV